MLEGERNIYEILIMNNISIMELIKNELYSIDELNRKNMELENCFALACKYCDYDNITELSKISGLHKNNVNLYGISNKDLINNNDKLDIDEKNKIIELL